MTVIAANPKRLKSNRVLVTWIRDASLAAASKNWRTALGLSDTGNSHHVSHAGVSGSALKLGTCRICQSIPFFLGFIRGVNRHWLRILQSHHCDHSLQHVSLCMWARDRLAWYHSTASQSALYGDTQHLGKDIWPYMTNHHCSAEANEIAYGCWCDHTTLSCCIWLRQTQSQCTAAYMHELQNNNMTLWCCCDCKGCHCRAAGEAGVEACAHMQLHNMAASLPKLHTSCCTHMGTPILYSACNQVCTHLTITQQNNG